MELTIQNLIKIIIGILVVVIVVFGLGYLFFKGYVIDFFKNIGGNQSSEIVLSLIK